jgi:hypothetical protein
VKQYATNHGSSIAQSDAGPNLSSTLFRNIYSNSIVKTWTSAPEHATSSQESLRFLGHSFAKMSSQSDKALLGIPAAARIRQARRRLSK